MPVKVLLGVGVVAALVLTGGSWVGLFHLAQVRGQSEAMAMARAEVEVARNGALDARLRLVLARDEAVSELEGVRELLAVGTVWLDAEALAVVADRATRLARVVPQEAPPYIPGYEFGSVESLAAWEGRYLAMERLADERFV
ncbi:MAG: hypothetical protein KKH51_09530, partial [Actinobacteria bacterium]|nr:hypothetical protein [Actinomycetota bacterium]